VEDADSAGEQVTLYDPRSHRVRKTDMACRLPQQCSSSSSNCNMLTLLFTFLSPQNVNTLVCVQDWMTNNWTVGLLMTVVNCFCETSEKINVYSVDFVA